jgi:hypothetical protein
LAQSFFSGNKKTGFLQSSSGQLPPPTLCGEKKSVLFSPSRQKLSKLSATWFDKAATQGWCIYFKSKFFTTSTKPIPGKESIQIPSFSRKSKSYQNAESLHCITLHVVSAELGDTFFPEESRGQFLTTWFAPRGEVCPQG